MISSGAARSPIAAVAGRSGRPPKKPDALAERLCSLAGGGITADERARAAPGIPYRTGMHPIGRPAAGADKA
ncbi:hypothetical protein [Streptomyces katrae]|uniref:hypothetical protein n=1 Tax=Streptomyces katrae TaxID=68223 RepID=UPI0012FF2141|nr:hypothetical protein [Streptomyces katrae]